MSSSLCGFAASWEEAFSFTYLSSKSGNHFGKGDKSVRWPLTQTESNREFLAIFRRFGERAGLLMAFVPNERVAEGKKIASLLAENANSSNQTL